MKRSLIIYAIGLVLAAIILASAAALYTGRKIFADKDAQPASTPQQPEPPAVTEPEPQPATPQQPEPPAVTEPEPVQKVLPTDPDIQEIVSSLKELKNYELPALIAAAQKGDLATVQQHIQAGENINVQDVAGYTPLIAAVMANKTDVVEALLAAKADPNVADVLGISPLMYAAYKGQTSVVKLLLNAGADKTHRDIRNIPIQIYAQESGVAEIIELFAE